MSFEIAGLGHYLPSRVIDNAQMESWLNLEAGWIERRTGIRTRHWVEEESLVDIAEQAANAALRNAGISKNDIALTILATSTPDHLLPPTAPLLAYRLGLLNSGAFDLSGACSGYLYALTLADGFIRSQDKPILIVAANILSRRINFAETSSAILFGDAAGATVLVPVTDATKGLLGVKLISDGSGYQLISIPAGGNKHGFSKDIPSLDYKMRMQDGQRLYSQAVQMMVTCASIAMEDAQLNAKDINRLVPHQANARICHHVAKKLGISMEKTLSVVREYGNTSAAGMALSLSLSHQANKLASGEKILLTTAGAGLIGGAVVIGI